MAKIKFFIRSKTTPANINLRFTIDKENQFRKKTNILIDPTEWDNKKGKVKGSDADLKKITSDLQKLQSAIIDNYNDAVSRRVQVDNEWLEEEIAKFQGKKKKNDADRLVNYMDVYIKKLPYKSVSGGKSGVVLRTIQKYNTLKAKIEAYEKFKKKRYYVKDVNLKFADDLVKYFVEVDKLGLNTTGRYLKYIKSICIDAGNHGLETHPQLELIKGFAEKAFKVYLRPDELEQIESTHFEREALRNVKDWLLIGCYIGQRVSDLLNLTEENIIVRNGIKMIELTQQKTGKRVAIPVHPKVDEILQRNNGKFPYRITDQKFNDHLKDVCKIAGLKEKVKGNKMAVVDESDDVKVWRKEKGTYEKWELVSSHICRRSFATNFYSEIPTAILKTITGHSTEAQFLEYIGKTQNDFAMQLADYWSKESLKAKKETHLTLLKEAK